MTRSIVARSSAHEVSGFGIFPRARLPLTGLAALLGACGLWATSASATMRGQVSLPLSYRSWTLESDSTHVKTTVTQFHAPLETGLALGANVDLLVAAAGASSHLDLAGGDTVSLDGASDVAAQVVWRGFGDRVLLQGGVNLPSGKRELNVTQFNLARLLGQPILGFRLDEYGRGFDWTAGSAVSLPVADRVLLALGVGYVEHGEYRLLAEGAEYRPGAEASVSLGLDSGLDGRGHAPVRADLTYRTYSRDELGPSVVFEEGDQFEAQLEARPALNTIRPRLLLRAVRKNDNLSHGPHGDEIGSLKTRAGNQLYAALGASRSLGERVELGLDASWSGYLHADAPGQEGDAFEFGPALGIDLGRLGQADLAGHYLMGTLRPRDEAGAEQPHVTLRGFAVSLAFRLGGR